MNWLDFLSRLWWSNVEFCIRKLLYSRDQSAARTSWDYRERGETKQTESLLCGVEGEAGRKKKEKERAETAIATFGLNHFPCLRPPGTETLPLIGSCEKCTISFPYPTVLSELVGVDFCSLQSKSLWLIQRETGAIVITENNLKKLETVKKKLNLFLLDGREREEENELLKLQNSKSWLLKICQVYFHMPMLFLKPEG